MCVKGVNKNVDIKFNAHDTITFVRYAQSQKYRQAFKSKATKGPKQDSQNRLIGGGPMPERGEP